MIAKDLRIGDVWKYNGCLLLVISKTIIPAVYDGNDVVSRDCKDCIRLNLYQPGKGLVHAVVYANADLDHVELAFAIHK